MGTVGYLLDTHTFLWATYEVAKLSDPAKMAMNDKNTQKFVSAASAYEIMNKYRLKKIPDFAYVADNYFEVVRALGAFELPINSRHAHLAGKLEWSNRDPFDRLLAAQAFTEKLALITSDRAFDSLFWLNVLWQNTRTRVRDRGLRINGGMQC